MQLLSDRLAFVRGYYTRQTETQRRLSRLPAQRLCHRLRMEWQLPYRPADAFSVFDFVPSESVIARLVECCRNACRDPDGSADT